VPEQFTILFRNQTGNEVTGTLRIDDDEDDCTVTFESPIAEITVTDFDAFDAFCRIRERIEVSGWRAICYGASQNCWPGGFCRSMAYGLKVYRLTMNRPATMNDVLETFETGLDVVPATVKEQADYYQRWIESQKSR